MTRTVLTEDRENFRALGHRMIDGLHTFLNGVDSGPADKPVPDDQRRKLANLELPESGMAPEDIIDFIVHDVMPWRLGTTHRQSYAWVNSPPAPVAILAEAAAHTINCGLDGYDHGSMFLFASLQRWLVDLTGFGDGPEVFAILFSGGTAANLNALTAARQQAAMNDGWDMRKEGLQSGRPKMVAYASDQVHSSVQRCVEQLGIGSENLRSVPTGDDFRMQTDTLEEMIAADKSAGHRPFAVVGSAGTTNVGAIDPLHAIADIAEREQLWFHVDGAYGGLGGLDPEYAGQYDGMTRVDSLTVDPHKWMHVPQDCGAMITRRKSVHSAAFNLTPDYLSKATDNGAPWPYDYMLQLTYADRALKTFATLARLGRRGMADIVARNNRCADTLGKLVEDAADMELLSPVSLSVVNFRYVPVSGDREDAALDALNGRIAEAIAESGEAHMPSTKVRGRTALRACILHHENDDDDMHRLIALVRRLGSELTAA